MIFGQTASKLFQTPHSGLVIFARVRLSQGLSHTRVKCLGQMSDDVAHFVELASLNDSTFPKDSTNRLAQRFDNGWDIPKNCGYAERGRENSLVTQS